MHAKAVHRSIINFNAVVGNCEKSLPGFFCDFVILCQFFKNNYYATISLDFKKKGGRGKLVLSVVVFLNKWQQTDFLLKLVV